MILICCALLFLTYKPTHKMGSTTKISWCDMTFNGWIGCRKVADECKFCYAETLDRNRFSKTLGAGTKEQPVSHWGSGPRHRTSASNWREPLKWNKLASNFNCGDCDPCLAGQPCAIGGPRPRVFCASLADWLDDENVPIEWLADLLKLIRDTPNLDWLLLTKRPQNWRRRIGSAHDTAMMPGTPESVMTAKWVGSTALGLPPAPPPNIWIGVSAGTDQAAALAIPARIHFLSCEPMLRPMDATHAAGFSWVIFGGESGSKARECGVDWIRDGVDFCRANGIAPFVKQLGGNIVDTGISRPGQRWPLNTKMHDGGGLWSVELKDSHGGDMAEWPEDLRVREFPI